MARGQPIGTHYDSVEWMSADCTLVLRGTIVGVRTERDEPYCDWKTIAFRVEETLLGEPRKSVEFMVDASGPDYVTRWHEKGCPLIVLLDDSRRLAARFAGSSGLSGRRFLRFAFAPRNGHASGSFLDLSPDSKTPAYTLALRRLERPEQIVQATKAALAAPRDRAQPFGCSIRLPGEGMGIDTMTVPVDPRLEKAARQWAQSKDQEFRVEGAKALLYFQSGGNIDRLRALLEDPASVLQSRDEGGRVVEESRVYPVRAAAYEVLTAWGIDVPRPTISEPLPRQPDR
jgi:hypothetical protein